MAFSSERFLLLPIGAGPSPWDAATVTVDRALAGGTAADVASPRQDRGPQFYFGAYPKNGQDETDYDNSPTTEGTFAGGTGHAVSDVITMSDGSTVTVDSETGGVVDGFTVASSGSTGVDDGETLTQTATTGSGTGFTLSPDEDNLKTTQVMEFNLGSTPPDVNFLFLGGIVVSGTGIAAEDVTVEWHSDTIPVGGGATQQGVKTVPIRASGVAAPRLDMDQPNLGLADAELPAVMAQGRLHSYFKTPSFPTAVTHQYHRLRFTHSATTAADQRLYVPIVQGGWGWQPDIAQWAPSGLQRRLIQRQAGDVLRGWSFQAQAVASDSYHLKLLEWFAASGNKNRAVFWQDPDLDERFIQNCALVQVVNMGAVQKAAPAKSASVAGLELSEALALSFNLAERHNDETEA